MFIHAYFLVFSHKVLIALAVKITRQMSSGLENFREPLRSGVKTRTPGCRLGRNLTVHGAFAKISRPYVVKTLKTQNKPLSSITKHAHYINITQKLKWNSHSSRRFYPGPPSQNVAFRTEIRGLHIIARLTPATLNKKNVGRERPKYSV